MKMKTQIAITAKGAVSCHPWVSSGDSAYVAFLNVGDPWGSVSGPLHFSRGMLSPTGRFLRRGFISASLLRTHKPLSRQDFCLSSTPAHPTASWRPRASPQTSESTCRTRNSPPSPQTCSSSEFHISEVAPSCPPGQTPGRLLTPRYQSGSSTALSSSSLILGLCYF